MLFQWPHSSSDEKQSYFSAVAHLNHFLIQFQLTLESNANVTAFQIFLWKAALLTSPCVVMLILSFITSSSSSSLVRFILCNLHHTFFYSKVHVYSPSVYENRNIAFLCFSLGTPLWQSCYDAHPTVQLFSNNLDSISMFQVAFARRKAFLICLIHLSVGKKVAI